MGDGGLTRAGLANLAFVRHLGSDWRDLAAVLDIPGWVQARFDKGHEAAEIWTRLAVDQDGLARVVTGLRRIGRHELADELANVDLEIHVSTSAFPGQPHASDPASLRLGHVAGQTIRIRQVGVVPNAADCLQKRQIASTIDGSRSETGRPTGRQILTGMGGVGKTQLAAATVRKMISRGAIDELLWTTAATLDAITSTFAEAGTKWAGASGADPHAAVRQLLAWLATTNRRWCVVIDDLADPRIMDGLWPPVSPSGCVLVTTRRRDASLAGHGQVTGVGPFTEAEAMGYLADKFASESRRLIEAEDLAYDLGYLPVAIAQAAAYVRDRDLTCAQFRRRFAASPLAHLAPESWPDEYVRSTAVTLALAADAANQLEPVGLARPLLLILSVLDPNGIPDHFLSTQVVANHLSRHVASSVDHDMTRDALTCLVRMSLVDIGWEGTSPAEADKNRVVRVHALVQRAVRDEATENQLVAAAKAAADALVSVWPEIERDPHQAQQLRANALALLHHLRGPQRVPVAKYLRLRVGRSLGEAGLVAAAIDYFEQLALLAEDGLGRDHPYALTVRDNLAYWRGRAGNPTQASAAFAALLADHLRVHGPHHPDTLTARANLARWRGECGDPATAAREFATLLTDRTRLLGPDHPDTLATRHNLAYWRGQAGDPSGALSMFSDLLVDRLRLLGPDHPDTLATRGYLAKWRGDTGDPAGAAAAFELTLNDRLRILGPDHPDTLNNEANLAYWRGRAGDPAGAAATFTTLLVHYLRILGPDHQDTLAARGNLALWCGRAGDPTSAREQFESLLEDYVRVLGPDHPDTLDTRASLARWRSRAGDPVQALGEFRALLLDYLRVLGPDHPDTLSTRANLARCLGEAGEPAAALVALEEVLRNRLLRLGADHPDSLRNRADLAHWHAEAGNASEASSILIDLLRDYERLRGHNHPETQATRALLEARPAPAE